MEENEILEDMKQKLLSTLKKWEHNTDWFYLNELSISIGSLNQDRFRIWFGIKTNDKDVLIPTNFHYTKGIDVQDMTWRATQAADFDSKKIVLEGIGELVKDVNRETVIERFIYRKELGLI